MNRVFINKNSRAYYCYIATAAFQSPDAPEVKLLRRYRDHVLDRYLAGRIFINVYYFISPPLARIVDNSAILRMVLRKYILNPLVRRIQKKHGLLLSSVRVKGYIPL
jgi:hypothetical protein